MSKHKRIARVRCSEWLGVIRLWKNRAKKKFEDAAREPDPMGKKLIEHGAMCYYNAAMEAEAVLAQNQDDACE